jgi:hypothetical protein
MFSYSSGQYGLSVYSTNSCSDQDMSNFLHIFKVFEEKILNLYLSTKESLVGLNFRFKHYLPLDHEKEMLNQVGFILQKLEQWWIKTSELSKGIRDFRTKTLKKREYGYLGLDFGTILQRELEDNYFFYTHQFDIHSREKDKILQDTEDMRKKLVRGNKTDLTAQQQTNSGSKQNLLRNSALNMLNSYDSMPYFGGNELSGYEKLVNMNLMHDTYKEFGGDDPRYFKKLEQSFLDLKSQKNHTQLVAARNIFKPEAS